MASKGAFFTGSGGGKVGRGLSAPMIRQFKLKRVVIGDAVGVSAVSALLPEAYRFVLRE